MTSALTRTLLACVVGWTAAVLPQTAPPQTAVPKIPLVAGLTIVTAIAMDIGDGESIQRVTRADEEFVHFAFSGEITKPAPSMLDGLLGAKPSSTAKPGTPSIKVRARRSVRRADLESARHYQALFSDGQPPVFPGSTAVGTSRLVLNDLKTRGRADFSCQCASGVNALASNLGDALAKMLGDQNSKEFKQLQEQGKLAGILTRVEKTPVSIPVMVNGVRVQLPAIHAKGRLGDADSEFYFLDDPDNPLSLKFTVGTQGLQLIKLAFPSDEPRASIASTLASAGRVEVYGIYFDFGSAVLRSESEPVLREIAEAMAKYPSWSVNVEGHTDNIGGDAANLDLSRRRAASVKDALVQRHSVAANRLATAGFGASRPKEPNDSLAGRARNRRVELVRK